MKEEVKLMANITAKSSLKWITIVLLGNLVTLICFFTILFENISYAGGGHGNVYAFFRNLFFHNICGFLLLVGAPVFAIGYFMIANKVAIQSMIHQLWTNKMGSYLDAKVILLVDKITDSNKVANSISNESILRLQLLEANKRDHESSRIKKKAIGYFFSKIKLDDIDFSNKDLKLSEIISFKLNKFISETIQPSFFLFWLLLAFQLVLIVVAQFF
ncbi:hypothetical protein EV144_103571 [Flavobacterium sp. 270]|uniref:hypothetical protein n=1 Tax=Flavobacterium sp. 270 TaxID=2512114 RepID=UPI0010647EFF|nr:hypothetical protein [Flavobacterium sp. 270]TDW49046.1 hypothetical protein EV144_103571 [Flavobacterium sp. 270]